MSEIIGLDGMTHAQLAEEIERGGRFVMFEYCFSIIIMTFKQSTSIYFVRAGESTIKYSIWSTISTLLFGWWGIPWGPIYSIAALFTNFSGGRDVTDEVMQHIIANSNR
jgi:hypothetical protein